MIFILTSTGSSPSFNFKQSKEWLILQQHFSTGITFNEMLSIAQIFVELFGLEPLSRTEKRTFNSLILWFRKHWDMILPVLPFVHLVDLNLKEISGISQIQRMKRHSPTRIKSPTE